MQGGDLATWETQRIVIVMEGVLCNPTYVNVGKIRKREIMQNPSDWRWSRTAMKSLVRHGRRGVAIDIVTFISQDVCDEAAEWMLKLDVPFSSCEYVEFAVFCESLTWRPDVVRVVDTDQDRLMRYGARSYETSWGAEF